MTSIQNKAIETYNKNLEFFKKHDAELLERINYLSEIINNEEYKERYSLEYVKEESQFDIFDSVENKYLYDRNPTKFNAEAVKNTNPDKINSFDMLTDYYYNETKKYAFTDKLNFEQTLATHIVNDISDYTNIFKYSTLDPKIKFKSINKFIFVGTLLGTHIPLIHKKIKANTYFICEANLEIFRLSLFTTDYTIFSQTKDIIFSIMDDRVDFVNKLERYFISELRSNYMVKYYSSNYNIQDYFERILEGLTKFYPLKFTYSKMMYALLEQSFPNEAKYPILNTLDSHKKEIFKDIPVLFLSAGPSLGKNIKWVKENQDKFFIVVMGAALIKVMENDITPDLITSADGSNEIIRQFPNEIKDKFQNIPFLASNMTNKNVLLQFNSENVYLFEMLLKIKETTGSMNGASIGEYTLELIERLGGNQIYLLGTDLALDQETGATHDKDYIFNKDMDISNISNKENSFMENGEFSIHDDIMKFKGNLREIVITRNILIRSLFEYNVNIKKYLEKNSDLKIYNLSDGVFIDHTIPTYPNDINIKIVLDKNKININKELKNHSQNGFTTTEKEFLLNSIKTIDKLLNEIDKIKHLKVKTYDEFTQQRLPVLNFFDTEIRVYQRLFINHIFTKYLLITEPYIYYNFNQNTKNQANLIKKVKKVWISQIERLCNEYKEIVLKSI